MKPILFPASAQAFTTNGLGALSDTISCIAHEELNGAYELTLTMPTTGIHYSELEKGQLIYVKPNEVDNAQAFRIYKITETAQGKRVTINAQHLSYDLSGFPVSGFSATGVLPSLNGLVTNCLVSSPFSVWTDIVNTSSTYSMNDIGSFRSRLGGVEGSILDVFRGEFKWDNFTIKLYAHRGSDKGVYIRYGKNLSAFQNERSTEKSYSGCVAFWKDQENYVQGNVVNADNAADFPTPKIFILDVSSEFDSAPTTEQLTDRATAYIEDNAISLPFHDTITVSFVPLYQTEEYKNIAALERVCLGDTVHVKYKNFDIEKEVVEYTYDCLAERYTEIVLGTKKASLSKTISQPITSATTSSIGQAVSSLTEAITNATNLLKGGTNGHMVIGTNANGEANELFFLDTDSVETAVNVLRLNSAGLGFSTTGINGEYTNAWTIDGAMNADFITAGTINGNLIEAGSILASALSVSAVNYVLGDIPDEVDKVYENMKFEDGTGLIISKIDSSGNIVSTYNALFSDSGMRVRDTATGTATLIAEGDSVETNNLTAKNFLIINTGSYASRFQAFSSDEDANQIGCFFINTTV